jgi:hypothetical protein
MQTQMAIAKTAVELRSFGQLFHRAIFGVCPGME